MFWYYLRPQCADFKNEVYKYLKLSQASCNAFNRQQIVFNPQEKNIYFVRRRGAFDIVF